MKTMCPPGYHHNGFVATHGLRHMIYGSSCTSCAQVHSGHKAIVVICIICICMCVCVCVCVCDKLMCCLTYLFRYGN